MTDFENNLTELGYKRYSIVFINKEFKIVPPKNNYHSSMGDLAFYYTNDTSIINKVESGEKLTDEEKSAFIIFGLSESGKPPTLIYPKPRIEVKRFRVYNEKEIKVIENEKYNDSVNLVLQKESFEKIYKSIFDNTIIFKYDLT